MAAIIGALTFATIAIVLHIVQRADPSQRLISELALHDFGGAMMIAFCGLSASFFGLQAAIARLEASRLLRNLLIIAGLAFLLAGLVTLATRTDIHIGSVAIAFIASVAAMYSFPSAAGRAAAAAPRSLSWTLAAGVVAGIVLGLSVLPVGIGQRIAALCLTCWLAITGWRLRDDAP